MAGFSVVCRCAARVLGVETTEASLSGGWPRSGNEMATNEDRGSPLAEIGPEHEVWEQSADENGAKQEAEYQLDSPLFRTDEFRMSAFKIVRCDKKHSHDWTQCPFAHPGEKAKRRDPAQFKYTAIACIDMKKSGSCPRGDSCPYAHNVFEYWMHPTRYRTQICNDGAQCNRSVCFFAHSLEELRVPPRKPGFPPEWRNRRHSRSSSMGSGSSPSTVKSGSQSHRATISRALSDSVSSPLDKLSAYKMLMSDGTLGSPGHHVPKVRLGPRSAVTDLFGSSPCAGISPRVWGPNIRSPFSRPAGCPLSARSTRSYDEGYLPRQKSSEDTTAAILQLMDRISLSGHQPRLSNNAMRNPVGVQQMRALHMAAVENALSARSSSETISSGGDWTPVNSCNPERQFSAGLGEPGSIRQTSSGHFAPFPMMSRGIEVPDRVADEGPVLGSSLNGPCPYQIASQVGGAML